MNFPDDEFKFAIFLNNSKQIVPEQKLKELKSIIKKNNKVIGYEIGNEFVSVEKAIDMAKLGIVNGVRVITPVIKNEYLVSCDKNIKIDNLDINIIEE